MSSFSVRLLALLALVMLALEGALALRASVEGDFLPTGSDARRIRRILCVADSFTYGVGVEPDANYPARLQRELEQERIAPARS